MRLRDYLQGTPWHPLEVETLRRRLFKIGARVQQSSRRIWINGDRPSTLIIYLAKRRVNSRLDTSFHFEVHYIGGQKKMELRVGLALLVMLALAVDHIKPGEKEKMRSLVQRPAA